MREALFFVYPKQLPKSFGGASIYVSPRADRRVLYPGWKKCAGDLMIVADKNVNKGDVVWDIGGNLGIFSVLAAGKAGASGRVFAVEPDPYYANLISRSVARLRATYAPIQVVCAAVSQTVGIAEFSVSSKGHARSTLKSFNDDDDAQVRSVVTVTLDMLLDIWPPPNVLKIDVEGTESDVLRGATRLLSEARPVIYIEVNEANGTTVRDILHQANYELYKPNSGNELLVDLPGLYTMARPLCATEK